MIREITGIDGSKYMEIEVAKGKKGGCPDGYALLYEMDTMEGVSKLFKFVETDLERVQRIGRY